MSEISEINEIQSDSSEESMDTDLINELDSNYESYLQEGKESENVDMDECDVENESEDLSKELDSRYDEYISQGKADIGEEKERYKETFDSVSGWQNSHCGHRAKLCNKCLQRRILKQR